MSDDHPPGETQHGSWWRRFIGDPESLPLVAAVAAGVLAVTLLVGAAVLAIAAIEGGTDAGAAWAIPAALLVFIATAMLRLAFRGVTSARRDRGR